MVIYVFKNKLTYQYLQNHQLTSTRDKYSLHSTSTSLDIGKQHQKADTEKVYTEATF